MYGAAAAGQAGGKANAACDSYGKPWWLMWEACSGLLAQGIALALLWWHFRKEPLEQVGCKDHDYVWFCQSSEAHVDGFPLLAAAVCVAVAQRQLLRKRIYYGLLRRGVILDFKSVERGIDPTLVLLTWCLFCAALHEIFFYRPEWKAKGDVMKVKIDDVLKVKAGAKLYREKGRWIEFDLDDDTSAFLLSYCAPCIVFLIFLFGAHPIEPSLVPLNSYYVDDPEEAKRILSDALVVDEAKAASASAAVLEDWEPHDIDSFYEKLESHCRSSSPSSAAPSSPWCSLRPWAHSLLCVPWPARALLHTSLADASSMTMLRMWHTFFVVCLSFLLVVCTELGVITCRSWHRCWQHGGFGVIESDAGYVTEAVILSLHLCLVLRLLQVTCSLSGCSNCCL